MTDAPTLERPPTEKTPSAPPLGKLTPLPTTFPASLQNRVGPVALVDGLPRPKGIEQLFAIKDFQRATQLYFSRQDGFATGRINAQQRVETQRDLAEGL